MACPVDPNVTYDTSKDIVTVNFYTVPSIHAVFKNTPEGNKGSLTMEQPRKITMKFSVTADATFMDLARAAFCAAPILPPKVSTETRRALFPRTCAEKDGSYGVPYQIQFKSCKFRTSHLVSAICKTFGIWEFEAKPMDAYTYLKEENKECVFWAYPGWRVVFSNYEKLMQDSEDYPFLWADRDPDPENYQDLATRFYTSDSRHGGAPWGHGKSVECSSDCLFKKHEPARLTSPQPRAQITGNWRTEGILEVMGGGLQSGTHTGLSRAYTDPLETRPALPAAHPEPPQASGVPLRSPTVPVQTQAAQSPDQVKRSNELFLLSLIQGKSPGKGIYRLAHQQCLANGQF